MNLLQDSGVLNPELYNALRKRFGSVRLMNAGMRAEYESQMFTAANGENKKGLTMISWGEGYKVCCPICGDQRFRLIVNHRHNTIDPKTGRSFGRLATCFNEGCDLGDFDDRFLKPYIYSKHITIQATAGETDVEMGPAPVPGRCTLLSTLSPDHSAIRLLTTGKKKHNIAKLENKYGVCFCFDGSNDYKTMTDRIVLPVVYNGLMVGWQGRTTIDEKPKYYTMPGLRKGRILVNYDKAKLKPIVVVTEGFFDAVAVGDCGVAILGSKLTPHQKRLLYYTWKDGALVMMLDSDDEEAQEEAKKVVVEAKDAYANGAANVVLPRGFDADEIDKRELWTEIYRQCSSQGVSLPTV